MSVPFRLRVSSGPNAGESFILTDNGATIGRQDGNTIVLDDSRLSRQHARIDLGPGGLTLTDLGSANGTLVNGQRVSGTRILQRGDQIQLGETTLILEGGAPANNRLATVVPKPENIVTTPISANAARLVQQVGGQIYPLNQPEIVIGREVGAEIALDDSQISRRHARLTITGNTVTIADLGSANGTFVNGRKIAGPTSLQEGDRIRIGTHDFRIEGLAPPATAPQLADANDATVAGIAPFPAATPLRPLPPAGTAPLPPLGNAPGPPAFGANQPSLAPGQPWNPPASPYGSVGMPPPSPAKRRSTSPILIGGCVVLFLLLCIGGGIGGAVVIRNRNNDATPTVVTNSTAVPGGGGSNPAPSPPTPGGALPPTTQPTATLVALLPPTTPTAPATATSAPLPTLAAPPPTTAPTRRPTNQVAPTVAATRPPANGNTTITVDAVGLTFILPTGWTQERDEAGQATFLAPDQRAQITVRWSQQAPAGLTAQRLIQDELQRTANEDSSFVPSNTQIGALTFGGHPGYGSEPYTYNLQSGTRLTEADRAVVLSGRAQYFFGFTAIATDFDRYRSIFDSIINTVVITGP